MALERHRPGREWRAHPIEVAAVRCYVRLGLIAISSVRQGLTQRVSVEVIRAQLYCCTVLALVLERYSQVVGAP
jgi:hypothetical protein